MSFGPVLKEVIGLARLFAFRGMGVLATFLTSVVIVREFGVEANGLFQVGVGYVMIGGAVGRVGQDQLNLRRMAGFKVTDDRTAAWAALRASMAVSLPFAFLSAAGLALWSFATETGNDANYLAAFGWSVLPFTLLWIFTEALRGWQFVGSSVFWQGSFVPVVFLAAFAAFGAVLPLSAGMLPFLYAACVLLALLGAAASWRSASGPNDGSAHMSLTSLQWHEWTTTVKAGSAFWALAILANVAAWIDLLLLYAIADASTVGVFHAIVRTGGLVAVAINIAVSGMIAKLALLHAAGDRVAFAKLLRFGWFAITICAAATCVAFAALAQPILHIWGPELMPYRAELSVYLLVQFGQAILILAPLIAGIIRLEKQLVLVQIANVPLKTITVFIGYGTAGLMGVIAAIGICTVITMAWTTWLVTGRLRAFGISPSELMWTAR